MNSATASRGIRWMWLSVLVIGIDQIVKDRISANLVYLEPVSLLPFLNLTLVHNTGAAFSFLDDAGGWQRWFFMALSTGVSIALLIWLYTLPGQRRWLAASLALILGGAVGNLIDRVVAGYVIDFIDVFYGTWHFPAFNVADSAISIGAVMLIIDTFWFDGAVVTTHDGKPGGG
ncbi:MAG TPA: signal peptidase II [Gammaproteobacteria bacterium]|nr:signal peptidase II [Gammaproteobacteria bacterium]